MSSSSARRAPLCSLHVLFGRRVDEGRRSTPATEEEEKNKENAAPLKRKSPAADANEEDDHHREETASSVKRTRSPPEEDTSDPFVDEYRRSLEAAATSREATWTRARVVDDRPRAAPFSVVKHKACGSRGERRTLKAKEPWFERSSYLGHGAFGAVFEVSRGGETFALKVEAKTKLSRVPWEARALDLFWTRDPERCDEVVWTRPASARSPRRRRRIYAGDVAEPSALWLWRDAHALSMPVYDASLADALRVAPKLPQAVALFFAAAALEAVARVHRCGILHCDLKPDNLMIRFGKDADGDATDATEAMRLRGFGLVLVDFGRAIDLERHAPRARFASAKTHVDEFEWPPAARKRHSWRHEIDIYALGVVLYILACARPPNHPPHKLPRGWDPAFWDLAFDTLLRRRPTLEDKPPTETTIADLVPAARAALDSHLTDLRCATLVRALLQLQRDLHAQPSA